MDAAQPGARRGEDALICGPEGHRRRRTVALFGGPAGGGYDVAIDDVFEPYPFERWWRPRLDGLSWRLVVVLPSLDETLLRSGQREKRVNEEHTRMQHVRCGAWDESVRIDTTGLDVEHSLALVLDLLREPPPTLK